MDILPSELKTMIFSFSGPKELLTLTSVSQETRDIAQNILFKKYLSDCPENEQSMEKLKNLFEIKTKALKSFIKKMMLGLEDIPAGYTALCEKVKIVYQERLGGLVYLKREGPIKLELEEALKSAIEKQLQESSIKVEYPNPYMRSSALKFPWEFFEKPIMGHFEPVCLTLKNMRLNDADMPPLIHLIRSGKVDWLEISRDIISGEVMEVLKKETPYFKEAEEIFEKRLF